MKILVFLYRILMGWGVFTILLTITFLLSISLVRWGVWYVQFDPDDSLLSTFVKVAESRPGVRQRQLLYVRHDGEELEFVSYLDAVEKKNMGSVSEEIFIKFYLMPMGGEYVYSIAGAETGRIFYSGKPTLAPWIAFVVLFVMLLNAFFAKYLYGNLRRDGKVVGTLTN